MGTELAAQVWEVKPAGVILPAGFVCAALQKIVARDGRLPKNGDKIVHEDTEVSLHVCCMHALRAYPPDVVCCWTPLLPSCRLKRVVCRRCQWASG